MLACAQTIASMGARAPRTPTVVVVERLAFHLFLGPFGSPPLPPSALHCLVFVSRRLRRSLTRPRPPGPCRQPPRRRTLRCRCLNSSTMTRARQPRAVSSRPTVWQACMSVQSCPPPTVRMAPVACAALVESFREQQIERRRFDQRVRGLCAAPPVLPGVSLGAHISLPYPFRVCVPQHETVAPCPLWTLLGCVSSRRR